MYDYHVHSSFSDDCKTDMNTMILSAVKKKLHEIAFTDHLDLDYPDKNIEFSLNFDEYHKALKYYEKLYEDRIKIIKGIELGIQKHVIPECDKVVNSFDYDFVLASFHAAEKKDLHSGDFFIDKSPLQCYIDFYNYVYDCLSVFKNYSVVGHINIIDRYDRHIKNNYVSPFQYMDIIESIFKRIIDDGKGIEINTSSVRYGIEKLTPTVEMLRLYKDLNGEIITIGSDAHFPEDIAHTFEYFFDLIRSLGFKYITTFNKMQPVYVKI